MFRPRRVRRHRSGGFTISLPADERELLRSLPGQVRELLGTDDPSLVRLFPPAYSDDPEHDEEYRRLMGDELRASHERALDVMAATLDRERLDEAELGAWLHALNQLRLVLGTRLDVTEEMHDHPDRPAFALYGYLGWLQEQVVEALSS